MAANYLPGRRNANELNASGLLLSWPCQSLPGERCPAEQKSNPTNGRDESEALPAGECQQIEAAAEQQAADKETPTSEGQGIAGAAGRQQCNANESKCVPHLIGGRGAHPVEGFDRQPILQPMR